jgi:hypothetical protein
MIGSRGRVQDDGFEELGETPGESRSRVLGELTRRHYGRHGSHTEPRGEHVGDA